MQTSLDSFFTEDSLKIKKEPGSIPGHIFHRTFSSAFIVDCEKVIVYWGMMCTSFIIYFFAFTLHSNSILRLPEVFYTSWIYQHELFV